MFKKAVFVLGLKGGVGKTFVASNIAKRLALKYDGSIKVALIDADLPSPNLIETMAAIGSSRRQTGNGEATNSSSSTNINTNNSNRVLFADTTTLTPLEVDKNLYAFSISDILNYTANQSDERKDLKNISISIDEQSYATLLKAVVHHTDWHGAELCIVDMPAGSGFVLNSLTEVFKDILLGSIIVAQEAHVRACERVIRWHIYNGIPIVGVLANMSTFVCTKCHERYALFGSPGNIKALCDSYGVSYLGSLKLLTPQQIATYSYSDELLLFDEIADIIMNTERYKQVGFFTSLKEVGEEKLKEHIIKIIVDIFKMSNNLLDLKSIAAKHNYPGGRDILITIMTDDRKRALTTIIFTFKDGALKIVPKEKANPAIRVSMTARALIASLLGYITVPVFTRSNKDGILVKERRNVKYSLIDAYFNNDLIVHKYDTDSDPILLLKFLIETWSELTRRAESSNIIKMITALVGKDLLT